MRLESDPKADQQSTMDGPEKNETVRALDVGWHTKSVGKQTSLQRRPAVPLQAQAGNAKSTKPSRREIELIGERLKARQSHLAFFLDTARSDVNNIRIYFTWVNGVYTRCYGHYDLVIKQANAEAQTEQAWLDFVSGVAIGSAVGLIAEALIAGRTVSFLSEKALETISEVGAEFVEGGIGTFAKFQVPTATTLGDIAPALKQVQALQRLDELNTVVLSMAVPGTYVYSAPIVMTEKLSADLRVAEAGGKRQFTDAQVSDYSARLKKIDTATVNLDESVKKAEAAFDVLRLRYSSKQAPSDQRTEQDVWIPWIAKQSGEGTRNVLITPVLSRTVLANHLVDIGLAARGTRGGRLNADISKSYQAKRNNMTIWLEPHMQLIEGARAEQAGLPAFWNDVFLGT
jgi:hypothetical protein